MKVLRVHAAGGSRLADAVSRAVKDFNRGLDIRLRFLSIGIEESVLEVADAVGPRGPASIGFEAPSLVADASGAPPLAAASRSSPGCGPASPGAVR